MLGSNAWFGGFWNRSGGHINPLRLTRGMAEVALKLGAAIYARSPAISIARANDRWTVIISCTWKAGFVLRRSLPPPGTWRRFSDATIVGAVRRACTENRQAGVACEQVFSIRNRAELLFRSDSFQNQQLMRLARIMLG